MTIQEKIFDLDKLSKLLPLMRDQKDVVLCHGCFDLLHIGHIRHFRQAKKHGDILVVTITPDQYVDKGFGRPAFTEDIRAEAIASLKEVDYVAVNKWTTAEKTIHLLKPDYYAKGSEFKEDKSDYTGKIDTEKAAIEEIGAKLIFTEDIVFSSTNLINRFLSDKPDEIQEFMSLFRSRHKLDEIHGFLDKMASLKIMVIGDTILDDYQYCDPLGKSNKDPVLALQYKSNDFFAGGVLAVANHVANFAEKVRLVSIQGEQNSCKDFISEQLAENITPHFEVQPGAPTLIKRRFLDSYSFNKLFEVYVMKNGGLPNDLDAELCEVVRKELPDYDMVIAADFGHGAISPNMIQTLCENAPFLSVNTQANAGNRGFHTISSYPRADFISLAEHEIRLETRIENGPLRPMMDSLAEKFQCRNFVVTRGRKGCLVRGENGSYIACPSLTMKIVDRVGAGDAFFSIASMASFLGANDEMIGFLGNIVGAMAVEIIGNAKAIDKLSLKKYITSLMK